MKDFYKEFLMEIDDIAESKTLDTAKFTYGFIWAGYVSQGSLSLYLQIRWHIFRK